jgi:hypothetical protein
MTPKFQHGETVAVFLYGFDGQRLGAIRGTVADGPKRINVARDGQAPRYKNLYHVVEIEGYSRPHEDSALAAAGESEEVTEGWFAEDDMASERAPATNPILGGLSSN